MITIPVILTILAISFIHWVADFHCQTHEMSMNKSKSNYWLTMHVLVYTGVTLLFWHFALFQPATNYSFENYLFFSIFIFSTHWITDYITSRMTSKLYAQGRFHDFFVVIGFDQLLHITELLLAYYYFVNI